MLTFPYLLTALAAVTAATPFDTPWRPGVYFSSVEVRRNAPARPGRVERAPLASGHLVVIAAGTDAVHQVPVAHVWGFSNAAHQVFRLVNYQAYLVTRQDSVVFYSRPRTVQYGRNATTFTEHFFSLGLDGDLHPLNRRQLRKQLATH